MRAILPYIHNTWFPEWMGIHSGPGWTRYNEAVLLARSLGRLAEFVAWCREVRPFETVRVEEEDNQ